VAVVVKNIVFSLRALYKSGAIPARLQIDDNWRTNRGGFGGAGSLSWRKTVFPFARLMPQCRRALFIRSAGPAAPGATDRNQEGFMALTTYGMGGLALAAALTLAGCGGAGGGAPAPQKQAGQAAAVGEPDGALPVTADFVAHAQEANCADQRNRLFMIDKRMVFWDHAGSCADNAYGRTLFGATPQTVQCSVADSIAGPQTTCSDEQARALFDTIVANLDKADLGLGGSHQVEAIVVPPKAH
jgi:hypothetical protein